MNAVIEVWSWTTRETYALRAQGETTISGTRKP